MLRCITSAIFFFQILKATRQSDAGELGLERELGSELGGLERELGSELGDPRAPSVVDVPPQATSSKRCSLLGSEPQPSGAAGAEAFSAPSISAPSSSLIRTHQTLSWAKGGPSNQ